MTEPKARRLAVIAAWINANMAGYKAEIEKGYCNTDFKPKGLRYITRKGKGRTGNRLKVYRPLTEQEKAEGEKPHWLYGDRKLVLDHNGVPALLLDKGKRWFALSRYHRFDDGTWRVWLNPYDQKANNCGWYTLDELRLWAEDKGPVVAKAPERKKPVPSSNIRYTRKGRAT